VPFSVALVVEALNSQSTLLQTVDSTLELEVRGFQQNRVRLSDVLSRPEASAPGRQLIWVIGPGGEIVGSHGQAPDLPAANRHVAGPTTVEIEGYRYRLAGGPVGDRWVVVGLNIEGFDLNRGGVVWPPWWLLPPGVIGVFLVSLLIGRWAAQPIERARRRQRAFAANASHELRTPLAVVEGEVSLALTRPRSANEYRAALERRFGTVDRCAGVGATRGNWTVATSPLGGARMGVSWGAANRVTSARRVMTA
jgi:signal transduction histidine kinase